MKSKGITVDLLAQGVTNSPVSEEFQIHGWPTIFALDESRIIRARNVRSDVLDRAVQRLLENPEITN